MDAMLAGPQRGQVKLTATHWQTGQLIAPWVKGQVFEVIQEKAVKQSHSRLVYLLGNQG